MTKRNHQDPEVKALHERISSLSAAILRISASLDVETVLREVVDSARALTGARCGVIATIDEAGQAQEFIISGLSPEEEQQVGAWPDAMQLFEHLRSLDAPLRLADLGDYVRTLGLAPGLIPCRTFQGTPMRHRGLDVGNFFLGDKEGGEEFSDEDEEVLVLFAAQAAIAIANARSHRDEQRARADLETLVETSPVGVVVFDAQSGDPLSINREAKRLLGSLLGPDRSLDDLREVLTSRLADGREVTLDQLRDAETLRAAEVELSVPDGRSLRMLVNATPIRSGEGEVESVVITMQDLAALEELERLRAEFLGMVSHELRAPLAAIKGSAVTLLEEARRLDAAETREFYRIIVDQTAHMRRLIADLLDAGRIDAGTLSVDPEPREVPVLVEQARTTFLSGGGRQAMRIDLPADLPQVMADERRIVQVLGNLLSNAARHSPESSPIHIGAVRDGIEVAISVTDEGRGIPPERLPHLFRKYADTAGREREHAGFGLGLVICKGLVEAHGGRIRAESAGPGLGTRFTFTLQVAGEARTNADARPSSTDVHPSDKGREPIPVLVVDDDPEMLRYIRDTLFGAGYAPVVTGEPEEVATLIRAKQPQLVLLDLVLPGADGIELMQTLPEVSDLPVIFISAYDRDETIARALEAGAADYIVKPFSPTELTARVRAVLRRRAGAEPFVLGNLSVDYDRRLVTVADREVRLTPKEYELLCILSINAGRVTTYDTLLRQVWGNGSDGNTAPVRDFLKKLRRKLGDDPAKPAWIFNERGVGYRMPRPGEG
ncbi:MAG: response regulator [Rhodospirillales bacterium]|nr:response regulator [Rhodospirillales bacterium]